MRMNMIGLLSSEFALSTAQGGRAMSDTELLVCRLCGSKPTFIPSDSFVGQDNVFCGNQTCTLSSDPDYEEPINFYPEQWQALMTDKLLGKTITPTQIANRLPGDFAKRVKCSSSALSSVSYLKQCFVNAEHEIMELKSQIEALESAQKEG